MLSTLKKSATLLKPATNRMVMISKIQQKSFSGTIRALQEIKSSQSEATTNTNSNTNAGKKQKTINTEYEELRDEEFERIFEEAPKEERYESKFLMTLLRLWKSYIIRYAAIVFSFVAAGYLVWETTSWFSSITFKGVAQWSFATGFIVGIAFVACLIATFRYFSLRSTLVYNAALKQVLANPELRDKLGVPIKAGKFRAYSYVYPDVQGENHEHNVSNLRKMMFWRPVRLQMIFQLKGSKGKEAMVSLEASKRRGISALLGRKFKFHSLAVEIPDDEDRFVMKGEADSQVDTSSFKL